MVFLYKRFGDKSNRLLQNMHFEAYCKYNDIEYHNLEFYDMENFYRIKDKYSFNKIPKIFLPKLNIRYSIIENISKFADKLNIKNFLIFDYMNIEDRNNIKLYDKQILNNKDKTIFVSGWEFRVPAIAYKYRNYFKEKYTPKLEKSSYIYIYILDKFKNYDIKVGVHIRRGDYIGWNNGKYYYDDKVYYDKIEQFSNLFKDKKILFILFSNEEVTLKPKQDYIISKCTWYEDHYLLSLCDYIIGAPSTFTIWASFIGNVPLMHIYDKNDRVDFDSFNVDINMTPL